jgi:hypothetical protein
VRLGSICQHPVLPNPTPPPLRGPQLAGRLAPGNPPSGARPGEDLAADDPAGDFAAIGDEEGLDHAFHRQTFAILLE